MVASLVSLAAVTAQNCCDDTFNAALVAPRDNALAAVDLLQSHLGAVLTLLEPSV